MAKSSRILSLNLGMQSVCIAEFEALPEGGLQLRAFQKSDLIADPSESAPQPLGDTALAAELASLCAGIDHLHTLPVPQVDPSVAAALKAMGYAEDDGDDAPAPPPPRPGGGVP